MSSSAKVTANVLSHLGFGDVVGTLGSRLRLNNLTAHMVELFCQHGDGSLDFKMRAE